MNRINYPVVASLLIALVVLSSSSSNAAKEKFPVQKKIKPNAALFYWQAFALLPQLDPQQAGLVNRAIQKSTIDPKVEKILDQCQSSFELTQRINPEMACDWGIVSNGPMTHLPHLGKAKMLAQLCVLQAKRNLSNDKHKSAMKNIQSAMLIGRHIDEGEIVCLLVGNAIKRDVMRGLRSSKDHINPSIAKIITQLFRRIPKSATLKGAIIYEGDSFTNWLQIVFKNGETEAKKQLRQLVNMSNQPKGKKGDLPLSNMSQEKILSDISGLRQLFTDLAHVSESSPENQPSEIAAWKRKVNQSENAFAILLPGWDLLEKVNQFNKNWDSFQIELKERSKK